MNVSKSALLNCSQSSTQIEMKFLRNSI